MSTILIERLGHKGDGISQGPVYVPNALPGETVTGTLEGDRLSQTRIVTASPDRVKPVCRHFNQCGGCQLQHASDAFLSDWKEDLVRTALLTVGLKVTFLPIHVSEPKTRRRATVAARRTKKGALVGFYAKASEVIVEIPDCKLLHPDLIAARPAVEALARAGASRKNALSVTLTCSEGGLDVSVSGGKALTGELRIQLAQVAQAHGLARLSWQDEPVVTRAAPVQRFGRAEVVPPPGTFLQATPAGEHALQADVLQIVTGADKVLDLFAGCGTFALPIAETAQVHAVEGDVEMIRALDAGWRKAQGMRALSSEARDLFRRPLETDELDEFDAVVLDPPRAGAEAQTARLAASQVPVIAYVSCNPASFARDAATLCSAGYRMGPVRVVDQFRWSSHVELVASFRRS